MMKRLLHISVMAIIICGLFASCGKDEAEVIPRGKMAKIYAEMLATDQWIVSTPGIRMIADTSLVYEPILEKYGYDSDDYRKSIDVYMNDPERFARILRTTGEILDKRIKELQRQQHILDLKARLPKIKADFKPEEFFPYMFDEPYVHYYDSVAFEPDSVLRIYRLISVERADTIYDRLRMVVLDSLQVCDSLQAGDSLLTVDTLAVSDQVLGSLVLSDTTVRKMRVLKKTVEEPYLKERDHSQNIVMDKALKKR